MEGVGGMLFSIIFQESPQTHDAVVHTPQSVLFILTNPEKIVRRYVYTTHRIGTDNDKTFELQDTVSCGPRIESHQPRGVCDRKMGFADDLFGLSGKARVHCSCAYSILTFNDSCVSSQLICITVEVAVVTGASDGLGSHFAEVTPRKP